MARVNTVLTEKTRNENFIKSKGLKRLDDVNAAKNRIQLIDTELPAMNLAVSRQRKVLDAFTQFMNDVSRLQESGELVIRVVGQQNDVI